MSVCFCEYSFWGGLTGKPQGSQPFLGVPCAKKGCRVKEQVCKGQLCLETPNVTTSPAS